MKGEVLINPLNRPVYDQIPSPGIMRQKALVNMQASIADAKRKEQDRAIVADRKKRIAASIEAQKRPFSAQQLADETQATGDKFRLFPNDPHSFFDDYLNPAVFIGNMASHLGRAPLNIQQGNYGDAALSVAAPLAFGALEGFMNPYINKAQKYIYNKIPAALKPSKTPFAQNVDDILKGSKEIVDPETGESKFFYELNDLPDPPNESFNWFPTSKLRNKNDIVNTNGLNTFKNSLSNIYKKGKGQLTKLFVNTNQYDVSKPFASLEDYKRWGKNIYKELDYVEPELIRDAHKKAIKYFKSTGQWSDVGNSNRDYGLFIRSELADKIPSFAKPVVVDPKTGARFVYGQDGWHPSLYPENQQEMYFNMTQNQADHYKSAPWAAQEAQPVSSWEYNINKLTPQENNLITAYAHGYDNTLNNVFRSRPMVAAKRFYETKGDELNTAIQKNKFPLATQVRRGVDNYSVEILDPVTHLPTGIFKKRSELGVGDVFKDKGFMSTSLNTDNTWGSPMSSEIIDIPGGGVQSYGFPNAMANSPFFNEAEAILPKGLIRKVEEVREPIGGKYDHDFPSANMYPNNARIRTSILNPYNVLLPVVGGAAAIQGQKKQGGPIVNPRGFMDGQPPRGFNWRIPGNTLYNPTPNKIRAVSDNGIEKFLNPFDETQVEFPGADYVDEYPLMKSGGQHGGLDRWFAEKWVDVKTGKTCGRQEGENRSYPACRPSRRVSSETPKTSSEMSPAEKAKFKRTKISSERIPYNHKRN